MRRIAVVVGVILLAGAAAASGAEDPVGRAMKLYERRHYAEAAYVLRQELGTVDPAKRGAANLTLGMIYLRNAALHRELYRVALDVQTDYLKKLSASRGKTRSRYADLYLAQAYLESGRTDQAPALLEPFIADEATDPRSKAVAKVMLGLHAFFANDKQKAEEIWSGIDAADPEVKSELAAEYARAGLKEKDPVALADESLAAAKRSGKALPLRLVKNVLAVYASAGLTNQGLDLLKSVDLKSFSYREAISKSKVINFYDPGLLNDMATIFLQAGTSQLEKAAADQKLKDSANYYLGEAYALAGNIDQSARVTASFIAAGQMPQEYRDRAAARQAANQYLRGRQFDAIGVWGELSQKQPGDPGLLAEILLACSRVKVDCLRVAQRAATAVESGEGEGKRLAALNIGLGRYYLGKRDYAKAVSYLEAGRDKSNKNKIESNDPEMLVGLSEAYYRTKKFSEGLEIYFEMSKQFPEVRQIQEAMQGVYSMEHKSAGDVKIF